MFFNDWETIGRTILLGFLAYLTLILFLRISGKRTLSKMNAFDFVITVALGSTLATILLNKNVALTEGISALFILIAMQYIVAWLSVRSNFFGKLIKSEPELIYYKDQFFYKVMKKNRILKVEILQAARSSGIESLDMIEAVVLETNGTISIIKKSDELHQSTLFNVKNDNVLK
ncbi:DUF421 domain-containing protein [Oceanobacillus longus]|uniref:DUF421 domain-containing protein n=1 Tax=Oceanobacillus longus TaxID=930120 RepID=A0ABV8GUX3_9BACI